MVLLPYKDSLLLFSRLENIMSRCIGILCNEDGSIIPLTFEIQAEWEARFNSFAGKETLRCIIWALKRIPMGQQVLAFEDEKDVTLIELVGMLDPPREEVQDAILPCMNAGRRVIIVTGKSLCRKIGVFDHLEEFVEFSYTASEFEELSPLQKTVALQHLAHFMRVEPFLPVFASTKQLRFLDPAPIQTAAKLCPNDMHSQDAAA
ncbi:hypothetical protein Nepgr_022205 [Nepenthes gracilis]|uniref:Uncharacterized protein n=1 Tax=Nepenthes gracilis TaxID=150966 RepID=A0AAD3T0B6_NEPGR|nr:hypothetical protein Nepgr_022205 [Nepenthes gracilis]